MKKLILSLALTLSLVFASNAQSANTLLYELSGNGLEKPSYIYGTIHLMCESDFAFSDQLNEKLGEAEQIVLELDMDDPSMMMKMQQNMAMKGGEQIKDLVSAEEYDKIKSYFQNSLGMPLDQMGMMKPFILSSLLYPSMLGCPIKSYEMEFVQNAKANSKEVLGLETVEFQMGIFDDIPYADQAEMLVQMIDEMDIAKVEFAQLVEAYKKGNLDELSAVMEESTFDMGEQAMEKLLNDRNEKWVPLIGEMAAQKSSIFAVGAGHLGGEEGILKLLAKAGYTITPIK